MPGKFVPLSTTQHKKLRGAERAAYEIDLYQYEQQQQAEREEAYELSNERLRERLDELETRLAHLENPNQ
jgi:hypothetical protein